MVKSSRKPTKHKNKHKPKRPLSAYNYFFSDQRKKIIKAVNCDNDAYRNKIDPGLSKEIIEKLRDGDGKVKFEMIGKLIGNRWKNINDEKMVYYKSLAGRDKKRYANELENYNQRKQSMRQEATLFTEINYVYPQEQHMVQLCMQSRPYTMHMSHMGYMPSYSNGNGHGQMPIMASPNHCYVPSPSAHNHNARHTNEVRYDSRDEYHYATSSSQPGYYPSYPPHASRNEQWLYGHQNQVTPVHSNVYQVQYPSSSMRAFE